MMSDEPDQQIYTKRAARMGVALLAGLEALKGAACPDGKLPLDSLWN